MELDKLREKIAKEVAESHGYVFPCGIEEEDESFRYWADKILPLTDVEGIRKEERERIYKLWREDTNNGELSTSLGFVQALSEEGWCSPENPCCERRDEYNGFASGPTTFTCPKNCSCHD